MPFGNWLLVAEDFFVLANVMRELSDGVILDGGVLLPGEESRRPAALMGSICSTHNPCMSCGTLLCPGCNPGFIAFVDRDTLHNKDEDDEKPTIRCQECVGVSIWSLVADRPSAPARSRTTPEDLEDGAWADWASPNA